MGAVVVHDDVPQALTVYECRDLATYASDEDDGPHFRDAPDEHPAVQRVLHLMREANHQLWQHPHERFWGHVVRYGEGAYFPPHTDYDPARGDNRECITYASSTLLSDPREFSGGELHANGEPVPLSRGAVAIFDGFTRHHVDTVRAGVRLALVVFAVYGTNIEAHARGWPQNRHGGLVQQHDH